MKIQNLILTAFSSVSTGAFAAPTYIVVFDEASEARVVEAAKARVQDLARETGNGEVNLGPHGIRAVAELSDAAAAEIKSLPGVKIVEADIQYHTFSPGFRAQDYVDHTVLLKSDLSDHERNVLIERIEALSKESGTGVVTIQGHDVLTANLGGKAAFDVEAMDGILGVEASRGVDTRPVDHRASRGPRPQVPIRTADNVDRTIMFLDPTPAEREILVATIRALARETGSGHVEIISEDILIANLSSKAAFDVAKMPNVLAVEDSRTSTTQCQDGLE